MRLLAEHPEWKTELRRLLLSEESLALPEIVRELAEVQRRTEERLEVLADGQQRLIDTVGGLKGHVLEITYQDRAGAYFGRFLRRVKAITLQTLEDGLEVALTADEFNEVLLLDLTGGREVAPSPWIA